MLNKSGCFVLFQAIQYREKRNLVIQRMVKSQLLDKPIDMRELMKYMCTLTPVRYCLATPGGFFTKTNKASILHFLLQEYSEGVPYSEDSFYIQDGNTMMHSLKEIPSTLGGYCLKLWDLMTPKKNCIPSKVSYNNHSIRV